MQIIFRDKDTDEIQIVMEIHGPAAGITCAVCNETEFFVVPETNEIENLPDLVGEITKFIFNTFIARHNGICFNITKPIIRTE